MFNISDSEIKTIGITPHGGKLIDRLLQGEARETALERANNLLQVPLSPISVADLEMIAVGAYSPLTGFMGRADYESVIQEMRLANDLVWSIPITLPIDDELAGQIKEGQEIALVQGDRILAMMEVTEKFRYDKECEALQVYGTTETRHPGVVRLYRQEETLLGGDIWLLNLPEPLEFPKLRYTPAQTRQMFAQKNWRSIAGFQTRNPLNRAHEHILKHAMEVTDGLFLQPLVGETKPDDIPVEARMRSYQTLLHSYYPAEHVLLGVFPAAMRFAGPREAIFHALCRKNYGCTHFIVGRDHAGVGNYYALSAACDIFKEFPPEEIGIQPLPYPEIRYYCPKCRSIATPKICPHHRNYARMNGTQIRQILAQGKMPPKEDMRPEVSGVLMEAMLGKKPVGYFVNRAVDILVNTPQEFIPLLSTKLRHWRRFWFKKPGLKQLPEAGHPRST